MRYLFVLACLAIGCNSAPRVLELRPSAEFRAWHDGAAMPALNEALSWWEYVGVHLELVSSGGVPMDAFTHDNYPFGAAYGFVGSGSPFGVAFDTSYFDIALANDADAELRSAAVNEIAHEIGHALGCEHVMAPAAIMYPWVHTNPSGATSADTTELMRVGVL